MSSLDRGRDEVIYGSMGPLLGVKMIGQMKIPVNLWLTPLLHDIAYTDSKLTGTSLHCFVAVIVTTRANLCVIIINFIHEYS